MLGVKTIGNATLIAYDGKPVLVTDPWYGDVHPAYFGSWTLSHEVPQAIKAEIEACDHVWFSHGHPDHLNPSTAPLFRGKKILLPNHVGSRIAAELRNTGFDVIELADRTWVPLTPRVKVYCIPDYAQNAALLVDVNGRLFVNLNDVSYQGDFGLIRRIAARYRTSYLLKLFGYGDADMINIFDEAGRRVVPQIKGQRVGAQLSSVARALGVNHVIPFSSFHQYQRSDSIWANEFVTPMSAFEQGFDKTAATLVPPFAAIDCDNDEISPIDPRPIVPATVSPEAYGDSWSDPLSAEEVAKIADYFQRIEGLHRHFAFINLRVGGRDHTVDLKGPKNRGITFEAPRRSLVDSVEWGIFDDLLIGNFMKTTLHGVASLYDPNFNYLVTKYADNGHARTNDEVAAYLAEYRRRAGASWYLGLFTREATTKIRSVFPKDSPVYQGLRKTYYLLRRVV